MTTLKVLAWDDESNRTTRTTFVVPDATTFTQGSILFAGSSGVLSQNNAALFWDDSTKELKVGGDGSVGSLLLKDSDGSNYVGFKSPMTVTSNLVWQLPSSDGSSGQALTTNGSGVLSWATLSTSLQSAYDGGNTINTLGSTNVVIDGTAALEVKADSGLIVGKSMVQGVIKLRSPTAASYVGFKAPSGTPGIIWQLPSTDGASGQALTTNGSGVLSWADAGGSLQEAYDAGSEIITSVNPVSITGTKSLKISALEGLDLTDTNIITTTSNQGLLFKTNGTGSYVVESNTVSGNSRGFRAVDLQLHRSFNTEIASGNNSALIAGEANTCAGQHSAIISGKGHTISFNSHYSTILGGENISISSNSLRNLAGGKAHTINSGSNNAVFGYGNALSTCQSTVVSGENNVVTANFSMCFGRNNEVAVGADHSFIFGRAGKVVGAADLVIAYDVNVTTPMEEHNHFLVQGSTANLHIGRYVSHTPLSFTAQNKLFLHTTNSNNQAHAVTLCASPTMTSTVHYTLPTTDGSVGQVLSTGGSGNLSWISPSKWTLVSVNTTTISGARLLANTTGSLTTITLPASPATGDSVFIMDANGNFGTNNLTVNGNGSNIDGTPTFLMNANDAWAEFVYNGTEWRVRA